MDLQLTNVEHFSKSNFDDKMRQLNVCILIKQLFNIAQLILLGCPLLTESSTFLELHNSQQICRAIFVLRRQYIVKTYPLNQD